MKKLITLGFISLLAGGCMSAPSTSAPTHRWASTTAADELQYRNDHARCQAKADIEGSDRALDSSSPAFQAYKRCMNNRGYELTAYNP